MLPNVMLDGAFLCVLPVGFGGVMSDWGGGGG
jgi:hypothetical protein